MAYADAHFVVAPTGKTDMKKRIEKDQKVFEEAVELIENMG